MIETTDIQAERIEPWELDDIWAILLGEGWVDYQRADLEFLVDSSPDTSFKFVDDGRIVGAMFANILPSKVGFLGPIILDKEYRKGNWGKILPHTVLLSRYLETETRACVLYSAQHMKALYQEIGGFKPIADFSRYRIRVEDAPKPLGNYSILTPADLPELADYLASIYGDPREKLVARFLGEGPAQGLLSRDGIGAIDGFVMARQSLMGFNLGPCLSASVETAADLLRAICSELGPGTAILQGEIGRTEFLLTLGGIPFESTTVRSTKMVRGDFSALEKNSSIHSIFSFYLS